MKQESRVAVHSHGHHIHIEYEQILRGLGFYLQVLQASHSDYLN